MGIISTFIRLCSIHHTALEVCEVSWGANYRPSDLYCRAGNHWPQVIDVVNSVNRKPVYLRVNVVADTEEE